MKTSIITKLQTLKERFEQVGIELSEPNVTEDMERFKALGREHAELSPVVECFEAYKNVQLGMESANEMLQDDDLELKELAREEIESSKTNMEQLEEQLKTLLLPKDPDDQSNIFLEIRAGAGGDEASLFAGDLLRMYSRYAENNGWQIEFLTLHEGEHGGYKEAICRLIGDGAYARLKFESGGHRVQRVPETESQGRIHTSACTVAILPELSEIAKIEIDPSDLKVDTYRSSGAGGQHVNTTDSAIRITHIPTGTVVECQDERSQHKNRARAMSLLQTKLLTAEREKQQLEIAQTRKTLIGSGDRSQRIRTYNFPQSRMTDHRINLTLYKLDAIMEGDLDETINTLINEHQAELLAALGDE